MKKLNLFAVYGYAEKGDGFNYGSTTSISERIAIEGDALTAGEIIKQYYLDGAGFSPNDKVDINKVNFLGSILIPDSEKQQLIKKLGEK
jgi:hypothetical protein